MEDDKKISVIVPVYNMEQYVCDCVKSVLRQTLVDFELILVDDGSQDRSRDICERLCARDKRIRLICRAHGGVSAARNAGIEAAKGKYVFFLDSDDMIHPQLLETLYRLQEKNHTVIGTVDLYYAEEGRFNRPTNWKIKNRYKGKSRYLAQDTARKVFFFKHAKARLDAIGGKMILRDALKGMWFDERLTHGEDTWLLYRLIAKGANVTVLRLKWYYYRQTKDSSSVTYSVESCRSRYKVQRAICDSEIRGGRLLTAVYVEWCILYEMLLWYQLGRRNQDVVLEKYVKALIRTEKKRDIFSEVGLGSRMIFCFGSAVLPLISLLRVSFIMK